MKFDPVRAAWLLLFVALPGWTQPAATHEPASTEPALIRPPASQEPALTRPPVLASEQPEAPTRGGEPNVQHTIIEDNGSKIDELRVRGQTQRITVTPKVGPKKSYQIITGDASRDSTYGTGGAKNATGKRVWDVLDF